MKRRRLYIILTVLLITGYAWVFWQLYGEQKSHSFTPCVFKAVTGVPCPSCGITRSLTTLAKGDLIMAAYINPLGLFAACIMLITPLWLLYDISLKKETLLKSYTRFEGIISKKWIAIPLIVLIMANWAWNIYKDL
ncbi:DUF2752 domain-containing protein [Flavobacterium psychrotrophum]|uniref:DUF2752 domain-containing protein n=1 Tax=Flavobacterium psychrotrophum TaxID=2294119 RepID=UPI000E31C757|nr:DUF2752 domain-containing protein [Flavobacterium psychrotrophum]